MKILTGGSCAVLLAVLMAPTPRSTTCSAAAKAGVAARPRDSTSGGCIARRTA
jgi:hypothetical protein